MPTNETTRDITVPLGYRLVVHKEGEGEHAHLAVVMGAKKTVRGTLKYTVWTYNFDDGGCHFGHYIPEPDAAGFEKAVVVFNRKCRNIGVVR